MNSLAPDKITNPIPIRFSGEDEALLRQLKQLTGLSMSGLIRRAVRYAAPRFLDGRVDLLTLRDGRLTLEQHKQQQ